ncbi:MAG: hypothetical protein EA381_07480 [Planctomycetaceae bacterium]|nr:MAG: hypothetical protein EA381_07480 [Planctomycetaceae bacterium]
MNALGRVPAVFAFEWRRALTFPRLAWLVALAALPPVLLGVVRSAAGSDPPLEIAAILVYVLAPCLACMMSVFLGAAPAISAELEGRSWVYLAVRPHGPLAVLLGKYLVAVSWALPVGLIGAIGGSLVLMREVSWRLITVQCGLVVLSCVAYAAAFLLIGVIAPKRAMVLGVMYAIFFEVGASLVPAAINLLTIQYRLRCLLVRGMEIDVSRLERNPILRSYLGEEPAIWHVSLLLLMAVGFVTVAGLLLRYREFAAAPETEG